MKKINIIFYLLISTLIAVAFIIIYKFFTSQTYYNIKNIQADVSYKFKQIFAPEGIEHLALIIMVKNEAGIIMENLVWHFSIGFRKFIIIDNNSSDGTRKLISEFATLTKNKAQVFIIEDPIPEHIQGRIITGSYKYVNYLWPEVKWVFPVDADEFWISEYKLSEILAKIPENCDVITILRTRYFPDRNYYNYNKDVPFYEKISLRQNKLSIWSNGTWNWKIALRNGQKNIVISQGNHSVNKESMDLNKIKFVSGNLYGLHMIEYTMRSIEQTHKKFSNGLKALSIAKKNGYEEGDRAPHWWRYQQYIKEYGDNAAKIRFEEAFIIPENAVNDPLPIKEAFTVFKEVIMSK